MKINPVAQQILQARYLQPGETPADRFRAIAQHLATAEQTDRAGWQAKFMAAFEQNLLILNSPIIANYGVAGRLAQGSACFVIEVENSAALETVKQNAGLIQQAGGGVGFNLSKLCPRAEQNADSSSSSSNTSPSGVIPFLLAFNADFAADQSIGFRQGAFMAVLDCQHPDLLEFIQLKRDPSKLTNFNLSIGITDQFMEAVLADQAWELAWTNPQGVKVCSRLVPARALFLQIVEAAHHNGEPGLLFLDRLQESNPIPSQLINCTNPCGEQPLSVWESCVLGHVNLAVHLIPAHERVQIDYPKLAGTVQLLCRLLDNAVTLNEYPLPIIQATHQLSRKIGLGITGLADVLIRHGVPYNSAAGLHLAEQIIGFVQHQALQVSIQLGLERGSFPLFPASNYAGKVPALRNATRTTIAPTGTTSTLLGVEGYGCEPLAALSYTRLMLDGQRIPFVSKLFQEIAQAEGWYSAELLREVTVTGTARVSGVPPQWQQVFLTAQEISYIDHLKMQAVLQKHVDASISKTINLPADATAETIWQAYLAAYQTKLIKGVTIYRAGSRGGAPIEYGKLPDCNCS